MKNFLRITLALVILSIVFTSDNIQNDIMDSLQSHDVKTQFKAYHVVYQKTYDLNSSEGIRRYKIFKQNVKEINEHNASNASYKQGINHLTDMTAEEVDQLYNLVPMTGIELKNKLRGLGLFDDYVDEEEEVLPKAVVSQVTERTPVDHRVHMTAVRNQGGCGSCWAFTTMSTVEGCWNKNHNEKLTGWLSTQHLVDCDLSNNGCNGGWYTGALQFLQKNKAIYDTVYPYKARRGTCLSSLATSPVQLTGFAWSNNTGYRDDANWVNLLNNGPVAVAIDANTNFQRYRSGIWKGVCKAAVNHAVTLVGYGSDNGEYYIVRNSWAESWGDKGHIKMGVDKTNQTCNLEKYAYQPSGFTS